MNNNIFTIPNVVQNKFLKLKKAYPAKFRFLCVGHLYENKGQMFLLKTFIKFFSENPNIELFFIGAG